MTLKVKSTFVFLHFRRSGPGAAYAALPGEFEDGNEILDEAVVEDVDRGAGVAEAVGEAELLDCLERNEKAGVVYHREGINGDYDAFDDVEALIRFIKTGKR